MFDAGSYTTSSAAPRAPPPTAPSKITNQVRGDTVSESGKNSEYLDHAPLGEQVGLSLPSATLVRYRMLESSSDIARRNAGPPTRYTITVNATERTPLDADTFDAATIRH